MLYNSLFALMFIFALCAIVATFHVEKRWGGTAKIVCIASLVAFAICGISTAFIYDDYCKTAEIEVKDITVRIHYIDGSTKEMVFNNVREWFPKVCHYKGDYSIRIENYNLIGAYRYDLLKETKHTVTYAEYYDSWR